MSEERRSNGEQRRTADRRHMIAGIFESWLQLALTVGVVLVFFAGLAGVALAWGTYQAQLTNRQTGFQNRAVNCSIQKNLGMQLSSSCRDPRIAAYFDPDAPVVRALPSDALCSIARKLQASVTGCPSP